MKKLTVLLLAATSLLYSCSKNDDNDSGPDISAEAAKLQKDVEGKWGFSNISLEGAVTTNGKGLSKHSLLNLPKRSYGQLGNTALNGSTGLDDVESTVGYIEFLSDSTYLLYDSEGRFFSGKFRAQTGDSILLGSFGALGGISFSNGTLHFKVYYNAGARSVTITANKAAAVAANERNAPLCRNWYVTREEDGEALFGDDEYYDETLHEYVPYTLDSLTLRMTSSGTYITQSFDDKGILRDVEVGNWKWHSTQPDRFVLFWDDEAPDEENDFLIIREVSSSVLKLQELVDANNDGIQEEANMVLRPAR